ncbi:uncharacterized protein LOC105875439 isoform X4 [Microcebus murinus]|uniref:uncharacterized protein LOC105875439 isoform X4 n=1 Tax=Microcebus murinus TaxID=30608 RepID=UPI000642F865|nr:RNA-binding Raly-like protein isoform X2 [Microcebus murinus]
MSPCAQEAPTTGSASGARARGSQARARAARPRLPPRGSHPPKPFSRLPAPAWELTPFPLGPQRVAARPLGSRTSVGVVNSDMAREPMPGPARPGQKRQQGTAIFCNYNLNYELYREDVPYRMHEYQRIPPLINRVPVKLRRSHTGLGVKSSFSPHKASRNSPLPRAQIKLRTEELRSIRGELSQIKAQVDSLLQHVERIDRQRDQPAGTKDSEDNRGPGCEGSSNRSSEPCQKPRGQKANPETDGSKGSTDTEQAVKNRASDQEGSQ